MCISHFFGMTAEEFNQALLAALSKNITKSATAQATSTGMANVVKRAKELVKSQLQLVRKS